MRRVLVIGSGQVGVFAARALSQLGAQVVVADIEPAPGFFSRFGPTEPVDLITADILDSEAIRTILRQREVEVVVHCAGLVGKACDREPDRAWAINVEATEQLAAVALAADIKRFVYVSSFAVYGRCPGPRMSEDSIRCPRSQYGRTKAAAEDRLAVYRQRGLDALILRPCGTYGPVRFGLGSVSAQFMEELIVRSLRERRITIQSSPTFADEFLYVKDLGRAIAQAALTDPVSPDYVYNVGFGELTSSKDLLHVLNCVFPGVEVSIETVALVEDREVRPLDVSRIRAALGFAPIFDLIRGLEDYLQETDRSIHRANHHALPGTHA